MIDLRDHIRRVPNFPKPGVIFRDIGTLLANGEAWAATVDYLCEAMQDIGIPDVILGIESRGFLVAAPVAARLGIGVVLVRKKGKLPGETYGYDYALEYGFDTLEVQKDLIIAGQRAVVMDDVLATGGTAAAATEIARRVGLKVEGALFVIQLLTLGGRDRLDIPVRALVTYEND